MQFMVQGCWGLVPAHLNELSPAEARGTFPGVVYQLGNLLASYAAPLQAALAVQYGSYGFALAAVTILSAPAVAFFASIRPRSEGSGHAGRGRGVIPGSAGVPPLRAGGPRSRQNVIPPAQRCRPGPPRPCRRRPPIARTSMRFEERHCRSEVWAHRERAFERKPAGVRGFVARRAAIASS